MSLWWIRAFQRMRGRWNDLLLCERSPFMSNHVFLFRPKEYWACIVKACGFNERDIIVLECNVNDPFEHIGNLKHVRCQAAVQGQHLIPVLHVWVVWAYYTTARPIATQFPGQGCIDDLETERSFDLEATWVIDVLGLFLTCYLWCLYNQALTLPVQWCSNWMAVLYVDELTGIQNLTLYIWIEQCTSICFLYVSLCICWFILTSS